MADKGSSSQLGNLINTGSTAGRQVVKLATYHNSHIRCGKFPSWELTTDCKSKFQNDTLIVNRHKKSSGHFDHLKTEEADRHTSIRFKYRYAVFCSFSGGVCSCFASRRAFFRSPCRLICAAYRQSSQQNLASDLVVVKVLPQCSQVSSRLRSFAASCR